MRTHSNRNLVIMTEKENHQQLISKGYPVAVLKIIRNENSTFSICAELFNCQSADARAVENAMTLCSFDRG